MTMDLTMSFEAITMDGCGHITALPESTFQKRLRDHKSFYCSTCGRSNYFPGKSDLEKAHEAQERAEQRAKRAENRAQRAEHSARTYKGHATRIRNRVARGVCPCCNRSFENLQRHMQTQHPDWSGDHS